MSLAGLTSQEAELRLRDTGPNSLPSESGKSFIGTALAVLREPMLLLLIAAGTINFLLAELVDAILLMVTVVIVLTISILQERRSERAIQALKELTAPLALVLRDGVERRISSAQVVVGDVLILLEGDRVVADAEIFNVSTLAIDESLLTGESTPVEKEVGQLAYAGSLVLRGHARAIVVATGIGTELGKIGKSLQEIPFERSKLQSDIDRIVRVVGTLGLLTVISVVTIYGLSRGNWLEGALAGIAAAMALIPEEFPVILTLFFALGAWRMARVRVIARKSAAIEALGSITVLAVDKTGTLTMNQMEVAKLAIGDRFLDLVNEGLSAEFEELARIGALASPKIAFDPMDRAFQSLAAELVDTSQLESIQEYPVEKHRLGYINIWHLDSLVLAAAKGAPEYIAELCGLTGETLSDLNRQVSVAAQSGYRVIAIAKATAPQTDRFDYPLEDLDFTLLGIALLHDPIRAGVPESVSTCRRAGIRTLMLTGDHPATALSIAREIGLTNPEICITGAEIAAMDESELCEAVRTCSVFARVRPDHKLRLIRALQNNQEVVGMTGDGVNDAPALRAADIGIAMGGRGTDVAREAAALVITDDDFTSIVAGIHRGRAIYSNIQKAMSYVIAVHVPIFGMALIPVFVSDWPLVLLPALVAFHEVIIDPACSIVFEVEEPDPKIMAQPPRQRKQPLFNMIGIRDAFLQGATVLVGVLGTYLFAIYQGYTAELIRSLTFATLLIANLILIMVNRSKTLTIWESAFRRRNRALPWILLFGLSILLALLNVPILRDSFGLASLSARELLLVIVVSYLSVCWSDIVKLLRSNRTVH